ncbi:MAG: DNA sulfur modification protein DndD [Desulfobulbaceae bacterium]|nr:DNA sulfur modification protein DndD [Desulfobulbaceae bacterium]
MHFKSITITNLFSYYGPCHFELTPPGAGKRNIVIIKGRNGQGKTSFLNSIKLLFGGVTDDLLRQIPGGLTHKQYIQGYGDRWWGVLNHHARGQNISDCSIRICWQSEDGEVSATRGWYGISDRGFEERIEVDDPIESQLSGEQAKEYLGRVLPTDYLPFFFFDGEEVQHLAEANTNQTIAKMEQLLNIRPAENVLWGLREIQKEWKASSMDERARAELEKDQGRAKQLRSEIRGLEQEIADLEEERHEAEEGLKQLGRRLDILGGQGSIENRTKLTAEMNQLNERESQCLNRISEIFGGDGFLMLTPALTEKALETLKQLMAQDRQSQSSLLEALKTQLPALLEQPPYSTPRLTDGQVRFYQQRLRRQIEVFEGPVDSDGPFRLDTGRAQRLVEMLAAYRPERGANDELSRHLSQASGLKRQIATIEEKLDNANNLADEERLEYARLKAERVEAEEQLLQLNDNIRALRSEVSIRQRELTEQDKIVKHQENAVKVAKAYRKKFDLAGLLIKMLDEFKGILKQEARHELEGAFNRHLHTLLDSNQLIKHVRINDEFVITYYNQNEEPIGMGTISAGMKQLAATSLLWALKEVSGRQLPVVIDTPLARIDLRHQHNLLNRYYPEAGGQVILLPTDSELDEAKMKLLLPHVYKTFELYNPTGEQTEIQEVAHG